MSIFPNLYRGTSEPLALGWLTSPAVRRAMAMDSVILPYPKTAAFSGRRSPDQAPEIVVDPFRSKLDG